MAFPLLTCITHMVNELIGQKRQTMMMKNLTNSSEGWMTQAPMPLHRGWSCDTEAHLDRGGHHGWDRVESIPTLTAKEGLPRELVLDKKK
jgi:hypothetical protein